MTDWDAADPGGPWLLDGDRLADTSEVDAAFPLLADLLERPDLLRPPEVVLPRLAWRGRTSGLIGQAQALLHDRLAERGRGIPRRDLEKVTYEDLRELIVADYDKNGRKSTDSLQYALAHLDGKFGGWRAVDIAEGAIDAYAADRRRDGAANGTINRELSALRRVLNLGKRARMVGRVPHVQMLDEDNVRTGFVEDGEFQALHDALPPRLRPLAVVAFITGWRRSELLSRKWRHVDLDAGWLLPLEKRRATG